MTTSPKVTDWKVQQLDDLTGKRYFITGGNSGLGFEAATHLRRANADVFIASRSRTDGSQAAARLTEIRGTGVVQVIEIDLASVESIRNANDEVRQHTDGLDAVINNAGVMETPQRQTVDGFELQFGVNYLGHFLLNHLLFDLITARSGRIVSVSSTAHRDADGINFDDPMFTDDYSPKAAYSQSKLACLMYGFELARRLDTAGSSVISTIAHPGFSATNLTTAGPTGFSKVLYKFLTPLLAQPSSAGAIPEVLAAAGNEAQNGHFYGPTKRGDTRGPIGESRSSDAANDKLAAAKLWKLSEDLLDISWTIR